MGTSGVPWQVDRNKIIETIRARKGRLTYVAKDLGVCYTTLQRKIKDDQEILGLISDMRNEFSATLVTAGEETLLYAMTRREDELGNALKAATYILNALGKDLGYGSAPEEKGGTLEDVRQAVVALNAKNGNSGGAGSSCESILAHEQSLLHQGLRGEESPIQDELGSAGTLE